MGVVNIATILFAILVILIFLADKIYQPLISLAQILKLDQKKIFQKLREKMDLFISSFRSARSGKTLIHVLIFSFIVWLLEGLTYYFVAQSLALNINFWQILLVLGIVNFGILIPASPGYIGTFEYFAILTLSVFGISKSLGASYAIILHIIEYLPITIYGSLVIWKMGVRFLGTAQNRN